MAGTRMTGDPGDTSGLGSPRVPLTPAEREVLAVLARGAGVSRTAATLGLTEQEVRAQLASAIRKQGARSMLEALLIAVRRGDIRRPVVG
jgi:DNA-binding CsgD family transcriptional regulator